MPDEQIIGISTEAEAGAVSTELCRKYGIKTTADDWSPVNERRIRPAFIQSEQPVALFLVTHHFGLDDIETAYDLFAHQRDGVFKVATRP